MLSTLTRNVTENAMIVKKMIGDLDTLKSNKFSLVKAETTQKIESIKKLVDELVS